MEPGTCLNSSAAGRAALAPVAGAGDVLSQLDGDDVQGKWIWLNALLGARGPGG